MKAIALDPGYGSTKICVDGKSDFIQTAVSHPKNIGLAAVGMKSLGKITKLVRFDDREFCVGAGAWSKGYQLASFDYLSLTSRERTASFYAALSLVGQPDDFKDEVCLVVGLPVPLLMKQETAESVVSSLRLMKREHRFSVDGADYCVNISRIFKLAQPVGAYMNWYLDDELRTRPEAKGKEAAIIDIGMNTLDEFVIRDAEVADTFVGGSEIGVRYLLESIRTNGHDITELDADLRSGRLVPNEADLEEWVGVMLGEISKTLKSLKRYEAVIPVGGGVTVAGNKLKAALLRSGAHIVWPEEPITQNVKGLWKWMQKTLKKL